MGERLQSPPDVNVDNHMAVAKGKARGRAKLVILRFVYAGYGPAYTRILLSIHNVQENFVLAQTGTLFNAFVAYNRSLFL